MMKSDILTITGIKKEVKSAKMFCNLKVGDRIRLSSRVLFVGSYSGHPNAASIIITNLKTHETTEKTYNEIWKWLDRFELINEDHYEVKEY